MKNIYILERYSNYFNRQISATPIGGSFEDDVSYEYEMESFYNINFDPHDGVETSIVLNRTMGFTPDYLIVCDSEDIIEQCWFVLDSVYIRENQYRLKLRRDVVNDNLDALLKNSVAFVEKGYVADPNNPLMYNSENMTFNFIKYREDNCAGNNSGWIVGYVAPPEHNAQGELIEENIRCTGSLKYNYDYLVEELPFELDGYYNKLRSVSFQIKVKDAVGNKYYEVFDYNVSDMGYLGGVNRYRVPGWGEDSTINAYAKSLKSSFQQST